MRKRLLSLLLALAMLLTLAPVAAPSAQASTWYVSDSDIAYPVEGGNLYFDKATGEITGADESVICAEIPAVIEGVPVTKIGTDAFYGCTSLTKATIPDSVTEIAASAFWGCSSLTTVTIPDSVTEIGDWAFSGCQKLITVTIPDGVTKIGKRAFYLCAGFHEVIIPASVTEIGEQAFSNCYNLTSAFFQGNAPEAVDDIFEETDPDVIIYYPEGATGWTTPTWNGYKTQSYKPGEELPVVVDYPVEGGSIYFNKETGTITHADKSVVVAEIPSVIAGIPVTLIGDSAFSDCTSLTEVTIPDSVTEIGMEAFSGCTSLTEVTIPDSVTGIWASAFRGCTGLAEVTIPDSVTEIGASAFRGCTSLTSAIFQGDEPSAWDNIFDDTDPDFVIYYPKGAAGWTTPTWNGYKTQSYKPSEEMPVVDYPVEGGDIYFEKETGKIISADKSVTRAEIPSVIAGIPVTLIGDSAFSDCTSLTEVTIPDSVTEIGMEAFRGCTSLTEVTIPDSVTEIWLATFSGCTSLTEVTIPGSVTGIWASAFSDCTSLTKVTIPDSVTVIWNYAFRGCTSLTSAIFEGDALEAVVGIFDEAAPEFVIYYPEEASGWTTPIWYGYKTQSYKPGEEPWNNQGTDSPIIAYPVEGGNIYFHKDWGTISGADTSVIRAEIPSVIADIPVTLIGEKAFSDCTSLTEVTIPDSVTEIGMEAFSGCTSLTEVTIPDSVTAILVEAFRGCTSLAEVTIPDGVTLIGASAFSDCTSLTKVTIPDSVTVIWNYAFRGCTSLTSAIFEGDALEAVVGIFDEAAPEFVIYYPEGASGWTTPTWKGYKTQSYKPGEEPWNKPAPTFIDVPQSQWYAKAVSWAVGRGITSGTSANTFSPNQQCTRAQVVTFLWAMAGKPAPKNGGNPFVDVKAGAWYYDAVLWAVENGITSGIDATHFGPNKKVTREQFVTFLWAYAGKPAPKNSTSPFKDVTAGKWYTNPVLWAVENGVTSGIGGGKFGTGTICTRAQVVTFLYAYEHSEA